MLICKNIVKIGFKEIFSIGNIYILVCLLNQMRNSLFAGNNLLAQMVSGLSLSLSVLYFLVVNWKYYGRIPRFLSLLNFFLLVLTLYGLYYIMSGEVIAITAGEFTILSNISYLYYIYSSLLPIYAFYSFVKIGWLTEKRIIVLLFVFVISASIYFWMAYEQLLIKALIRGDESDEFTNNVGYTFVCMFPLICFLKKYKALQYALIIYVFYYIMISMKRGAMLIGGLCLLYFIYQTWKDSSSWKRFVLLLCVSVLFVIGMHFIADMFADSLYFQARIEQTLSGDSSGRDQIYSHLIDYFLHKTSLLQFIFGSGANATVKVSGINAHNDWLELLINQGLLGVVIYLLYFVYLFRGMYQSKNYIPNHIFVAYSMIVYILFVKSLFSMSYNGISLEATCGLGFCLGYVDNIKRYGYIKSKENEYE